jgi:ribosome-binding protein aMBF1 (putative translation factor)
VKDTTDLHRQLSQIEHPRLEATPSRDELCEEYAARAFAVALEVLAKEGWTQRSLARHLRVSEVMVRDYRDGHRAVPLPVILKLPTKGRVAALREIINVMPELELIAA